MEFWDGSGISWTVSKQSASRSRQITTPTPHHLIFYRLDALPDTQPNSVKALKALLSNEQCNTICRAYIPCACRSLSTSHTQAHTTVSGKWPLSRLSGSLLKDFVQILTSKMPWKIFICPKKMRSSETSQETESRRQLPITTQKVCMCMWVLERRRLNIQLTVPMQWDTDHI